MTLVGTKVVEGQAKVNASQPTATDALFLVIKAERGRTDVPEWIENMAQYKAKFGDRFTGSKGYDYLDFEFRQGLQRAAVIRQVGPAAVKATVTLTDASAAVVMTATAIAEGPWYNGLNLTVVVGTGTERALVITHDTDTTINENSGFYNSNEDLLNWAESSGFIRLSPGANFATAQPNAQTKNMGSTTPGTDDLAGITDPSSAATLAKFPRDWGPGMVAFADRQTSVAHGQLLDHGAANKRFALCDPPDLASKSSVLSLAAGLRSHVNASWGAMFYPWFDMDGLTANSYRAIPPSAGAAALLARNETDGVSVGQGAGGDFGILDQARKLRTVFPVDQDREDLNEGGVNLIHSIGPVIRIYGVRSLVNPLTNRLWKQYTARRTYIAISAMADAILQKYVLRQIDGQRIIFKQLEGELTTMLERFYVDGALFGETSSDAYVVDTDSVNTNETIRNNEINAQVEFVPSPSGEAVKLVLIGSQVPR